MRMKESRPESLEADERIEERNRLVVQHVGLVKTLARQVAQRVPSQVEVNELVSVGMVGLVDAAGRYQPSLGVPFDAFARRRVHGAMLDSLRELDWAPRSVRKMRRDVDALIARLRHELQREPTEAQIAEALKVSLDTYYRMLDQLKAADVGPMRQLESATGDAPMVEVAIDPDDGPQVRLERAELKQHLVAAIADLPERERQILSLYYHEELTLAEIGEVIGVGESRVSQLRTQAIARLRGTMRERLHLTSLR
jgi:RNA polymerase sigma factor for flagellar operon FliA